MVRVENVVATGSIAKKINLVRVNSLYENTEYSPEVFPGLVYRSTNPKTTTLIFESGKVVCTGGKDAEMAQKTIDTIIKKFKKDKFDVIEGSKVCIQNIVATHDLGLELNLNTVAVGLGLDRIEYEPEQFPGLVYRINEPKAVMLIFQSGKIVCTGTKNVQQVKDAVATLTKDLVQIGYEIE